MSLPENSTKEEIEKHKQRGMEIARELADKEQADVKAAIEAHAAMLSRVVNAFEKIMIDENMTWRNFTEVLDIFNDRNNLVIPNLKIKEIKELYDRPNS